MATTLPMSAPGVLINPSGLKVPAPYKNVQFKHAQPAFKKAASPTAEELDSFNNARTYICAGVQSRESNFLSTSDISAIIQSSRGFNQRWCL